MVPAGIAMWWSKEFGVVAHRCPNPGACPGGFLTIDQSPSPSASPSAAAQCQLTVAAAPEESCAAAFKHTEPGCILCEDDHGRSPTDPFTCIKCGTGGPGLDVAYWLGQAAILYMVAMHGAEKAANNPSNTKDAFFNDMLKILMSYSSSAAFVGSALLVSPVAQEMSKNAKAIVTLGTAVSKAGDSTFSSGMDCWLGGSTTMLTMAAVCLSRPALLMAIFAALLFLRQKMSQVLFEFILAANYLDIKSLLDLTCAKVASIIKGEEH